MTAADDSGQKALESASDFIKVTTGLATGALVFSTTFMNAPGVLTSGARTTLTLCWIALLLSIFSGVFIAQGRLTTKIAKRNYDIHADQTLTIPTQIHQWTFFAGVIFLGITLALLLHEQPPLDAVKVDSAAQAVTLAAHRVPSTRRIVKVATVELIKGVEAESAAMATWHVQFIVAKPAPRRAPSPPQKTNQPAYLDIFLNVKTGEATIPY